ncbi:2-C-methyl-D-erythritol 4-phosphate cytidylyltransferase [Helicobacter sp. 13S00401-1]|uniref:IspD/TarI family cytidylyltransferase n=1 Tax=Helicobacter sp. 13S00401-1 TaxID=1905758 RepID=UPI000BA782EE|nr:IspD/TarI family cytidylyltransferase [Helicobacter sp. 13S00401-1]PAF49655.1 2-C-methyl-D-erythritol 4-phosphate cytidylyltransferase [Helicobacter sp. 13S00401-1]
MNIALIIAGGIGERMKQALPKQFISIYDKPIIIYTLEKFQESRLIDIIAVVCLSGWEEVLKAYAKQFNITKLRHIIPPGKVGQESIKNGIYELAKHYPLESNVLVHDAIRPNVTEEIILKCLEVTNLKGNAIVCLPCQEAMLETTNSIDSMSSYPRDKLKRTQTPQGFKLSFILDLHKEASSKGITNSIASCTLATELGHKVYITKGCETNIKLTTLEDIEIFKALLKKEVR